MLCDKCWGMLRGHDGRQWRGTYNLNFQHHDSLTSLRGSSRLKCGICRVLDEEWSGRLGGEPSEARDQLQSLAALGVVNDIDDNDVFRLDFKLTGSLAEYKLVHKKTFILREAGNSAAPFRTPISGDTASAEVLRLALSWITDCDEKCSAEECKHAKRRPERYPTRLLDLSQLKSAGSQDQFRAHKRGSRPAWITQDSSSVKVTLVDMSPHHSGYAPPASNYYYVTLSHCWGDAQPYTLKPETEGELRAGVDLAKLPKTFQDAIRFASQLHNVGWIWIDSLCIMQDGPDHEKDWLHESAHMERVYRDSYLNISATAANNSNAGLYTWRQPSILWEDEINLNVEGIPGLRSADEEHRQPTRQNDGRKDTGPYTPLVNVFSPWKWIRQNSSGAEQRKVATAQVDWGGEKPIAITLPKPEGIRRCVLIDACYWDKLVNRAPVNTRAWVLQERLMAPRVLHFCKDQIAWECSTFAAAEGHPAGIPKFEVRDDRILPEIPMKGLDPWKDGKHLREVRLQGAPEPDSHLPSYDLFAFELWARVVETYSRLHLTKGRDKLIALSGVAQHMSHTLSHTETSNRAKPACVTSSRPVEYVAGLWDKYFESQLLWRIEPVFQHGESRFLNLSKRPVSNGEYYYRAPSFSWASVDAQDGDGVSYGGVTDRDLLIKVATAQDCSPASPPLSIQINETGNKYGLVRGGHVMLWCRLRKIKIYKDSGQAGRFHWHLVNRPGLEKEPHRNIYLDAPDDDEKQRPIFDASNTYCIPAAYSERKDAESSKYIVCLLLQQAAEDVQAEHLDPLSRSATFRRIGLAKLSTWADKLAHPGDRGAGIMAPNLGLDMDLPHWPHSYREATGEHLIRII